MNNNECKNLGLLFSEGFNPIKEDNKYVINGFGGETIKIIPPELNLKKCDFIEIHIHREGKIMVSEYHAYEWFTIINFIKLCRCGALAHIAWKKVYLEDRGGVNVSNFKA